MFGKLLLAFVLLMFSSDGFALTAAEKMLMVSAPVVSASGEESLGANGVFACSWEDGSDELNTGAAASYVWEGTQ